MKNYSPIKLLTLLFFVAAVAVAQESPIVSLSIPYQNSLLYNRYLINPTFSFVGENDRNVSMFSRTQWVGFNDSPQAYQLNYSGRFSDHTGFGIGLYQQSLGVITSFGGMGNGAYHVSFNENMGLTVGANLVFYNSGIDMSRVDVENPDPFLMSLDKRSLFSLHPGLNFNYKQFDIGAYAENLVNYDFKTDSFVKNYSETTYSGHLMYTHFFENEGTTMKALARIRNNKTLGFNSGLAVVINFPTWGWLQSGYDSYYGLGVGAGVHVSKKLSVGYVYEKATRVGMQNFGATHEFNLVFTLASEENSTSNKSKQGIPTSSSNTDMLETLKNSQDAKALEFYNLLKQQDSIIMAQERELQKNKQDLSKQNQPKDPELNDDINSMDDEQIKEMYSEKTPYKRGAPEKISKVIVDDDKIKTGYYVVAGVFSKEKYAEGLVDKLKKEEIDAYSFVNPKNRYKYVHLRYCNTQKEALAAYYSNVDNTYFDTIWLLEVERK